MRLPPFPVEGMKPRCYNQDYDRLLEALNLRDRFALAVEVPDLLLGGLEVQEAVRVISSSIQQLGRACLHGLREPA